MPLFCHDARLVSVYFLSFLTVSQLELSFWWAHPTLPLVSHLRRPDGVTEWNKTPALHLLKKEERKKKKKLNTRFYCSLSKNRYSLYVKAKLYAIKSIL